MKKTMLVAALLTVMSAAVFATGNEGVKVVADSSASAVFKVYYSKLTVAKVKVRIFNEAGKKVFSEVIKNENGFVRPYNMKSLPAGKYTFEIDDSNEVETFEFVYEEVEAEDNQLLANVIKVEDNKFFLGVTTSSDKTIHVNIYDANDDVVYSANEVVSNQFGQLYNLKSIRSGNFTVEVTSNGEVIKKASF